MGDLSDKRYASTEGWDDKDTEVQGRANPISEASRAHPFRKERENGGAASIALVQPRAFARFRKILIAEIRFWNA